MFDSPLSASAYEALGVTPDADEETLRKAYRLRLRQTHPDTGGDAAAFVRVQKAWELVGSPSARASYDRGHGFSPGSVSFAPDAPQWRPAARPNDTRPRARSYGHPGGWFREQYLTQLREWVGLGDPIADPYDPALVRSAPVAIRSLLADALAEEATARVLAELGMGYTVWHDVAADPRDASAKIDHVVLGPSGLWAVLSEDTGGPVRVRRGELIGEGVQGAPVASLAARARALSRAAKVKFSGLIVVAPDDDVALQIEEIGKVKGLPVAIVGRAAVTTVLRRGVTGARVIGGNELFDIRTRLQHTVRFV